MRVYEVGGCVRDRLLGEEVRDHDYVVTGATSEHMKELGYEQVGADFPVFLHPVTKAEYALARQERKRGVGYHGFEVISTPDVSLEDDLSRRDLTINAMARCQETGCIIDPYRGQEDLAKGWLRHVSPAFAEDPVRVLRVARFAARWPGFEVHPTTLDLMKALVAAGELDHLTPERVWKEVQKALGEKAPERFIQVLRSCGALQVLLPEVEALYGVPQNETHHPEVDTGVHNEMVMQQASRLSLRNPKVVFAAMMHDLGKGITPQDQWPRHLNHEETGVPLVKEVCRRWKVPSDYANLAVQVCENHLRAHRCLESRPRTLLTLLENVGVFKQGHQWEAFVTACEGDARGRLGLEDRPYPQADYLRQLSRAVSGLKPFDMPGAPDPSSASIEDKKEWVRRVRLRAIQGVKGEFLKTLKDAPGLMVHSKKPKASC